MNSIEWWISRIGEDDNWNSMPIETKKKLLFKLKQCIAHFNEIGVSNDDLMELLDKCNSISMVYDAILSSWAWPDNWKQNKFQYMNNLKREIVKFCKESAGLKPKNVFKESQRPKAKGKKIDVDFVKQHDPFDFAGNGKQLQSEH